MHATKVRSRASLWARVFCDPAVPFPLWSGGSETFEKLKSQSWFSWQARPLHLNTRTHSKPIQAYFIWKPQPFIMFQAFRNVLHVKFKKIAWTFIETWLFIKIIYVAVR